MKVVAVEGQFSFSNTELVQDNEYSVLTLKRQNQNPAG
jgi:hypothetical protein